MKKFFLIFFLLTSCSNLNSEINKMVEDIDIYENLTFDEFKIKIINYAKQSEYPDINE